MSKLNYTVLIICEGEKTEPYFFNSIIDENEIENTQITIFPEPIAEEDENEDVDVAHKVKRKKRKIKTSDIDGELQVVSAPLPLNWVLTGKKELEDGTYDEVWIVFDHDKFPARREAFGEANKLINGKKVSIAFSSLSFEYYLLSHFERILKPFEDTDCKFIKPKKSIKKKNRNKRVFIRCGTDKFPEKDCKGQKCINGYAQIRSYWDNSDDKNSKNTKDFYEIIKSNIEVGFENSAWIRYQSDKIEGEKPIYDRNPYLTTDALVKRLMLNNTEHYWIDFNECYTFDDIGVEVSKTEVVISNKSDRTIIIPEKSICMVKDHERLEFGERKVVKPEKSITYNIQKYTSKNTWFKFEYRNHRIMFEHEK